MENKFSFTKKKLSFTVVSDFAFLQENVIITVSFYLELSLKNGDKQY